MEQRCLLINVNIKKTSNEYILQINAFIPYFILMLIFLASSTLLLSVKIEGNKYICCPK